MVCVRTLLGRIPLDSAVKVSVSAFHLQNAALLGGSEAPARLELQPDADSVVAGGRYRGLVRVTLFPVPADPDLILLEFAGVRPLVLVEVHGVEVEAVDLPQRVVRVGAARSPEQRKGQTRPLRSDEELLLYPFRQRRYAAGEAKSAQVEARRARFGGSP